MKKTNRGFAIFSVFKDFYKAEVRVIESSLATKHTVWIFVKGGATSNNDGAILLTKPMARRLIKALEKFINY